MLSSRPVARLLLVPVLLLAVSACRQGSVGSGTPGTSNYTPPAGARYIALNGSDGNSGSQGSPWRTLQHAVDTAANGTTIVLRRGEYRQGNVAVMRHSGLTIQPYPGESVWFTGSDPLGGFVADSGGVWVRNNWHSPLQNTPAYAAMIDPASIALHAISSILAAASTSRPLAG